MVGGINYIQTCLFLGDTSATLDVDATFVWGFVLIGFVPGKENRTSCRQRVGKDPWKYIVI